MLEVKSFSTLFPQNRSKVSIFEKKFCLGVLLLILGFDLFFLLLSLENYLQEVCPIVKSALKEYGISCELNLASLVIIFILY